MEVYLITGATSGIGEAIYKQLSLSHSCLLIARNEEKLKELTRDKNNQFFVTCNLEDNREIKNIFSVCKEKSLTIKGFIHCAGSSQICNYNEISEESVNKTFNINTFSFIEICKSYFAYEDRSSFGCVIGISSIAAERSSSRQAVYAASKAALNSAILSAAQEGIKLGIRVNGVSLGACNTPMLSRMNISDSFRESIQRHYPLGIIEPSVLANIIEDLISDKYKNMTGSIIKIDSGFSVVH